MVERATRAIVNKLLHPQIQGIKQHAAQGNSDSLRLIAEALGVDAAPERKQGRAPDAPAAAQESSNVTPEPAKEQP